MHVKRLVIVASLVILFSTFVFAEGNYYRFDLKLDAENGVLDGKIISGYVNDSSVPLEELRYRLDVNLSMADSMKVMSVKNSQGNELSFDFLPLAFAKVKSEKGILCIKLPEPLGAGEKTEIEIVYQFAARPAIGLAMTTLPDDPYDSLDAWYPKAMSFDGNKWTIDDDRLASYEISIDLPSELVIATSGKVVEEKESSEGRRHVCLRADGIRGFSIYGSNQLLTQSGEVGDIKLSVYVYKVHESWAPRILEAAADTITLMQEEFGEFPTKHLAIYCPMMGAGAFTCCNLTGVMMGGEIEKQYRWLVAHEIAHQYFGSSISEPRDNMKWLTAGIGLIMDEHYLNQRGFEHPARDWMVGVYPRVKKMGYDTTLTQSVNALYNAKDQRWSRMWNLALQHGKAFNVCCMLADLTGKDKFQEIIGKIVAEKAGKLIYYPDLISLCEEACGAKLDWFVADWIEGDATLDYAITDVRESKGGWEAEIKQVGTAAFPVLVLAETASGEKLTARVDRTIETNTLFFETDEEIKSVVIDPEKIYPDLEQANNTWPAGDNASEG